MAIDGETRSRYEDEFRSANPHLYPPGGKPVVESGWDRFVWGRDKAKERAAERTGVPVDYVEDYSLWDDLWHKDKPDGSRRGWFGFGPSKGGPSEQPATPPVPSYQEPAAGTDVDPFAELASVQAKLAGMAGQLDAGYQSRLAELRDAYEFAETPEEKAQLAFMLQNIEGQRAAGQQVIRNAYGTAIADAGQRASAMRGTAAAEGRQVGDLYRGAADRTAAGIGEVAAGYQDSGLGVGAVPVSGDATDFVHQLNAAAPREQALTQQLGNIAAEDVAFLGQAMAGEQGAQQGDLERIAMQLAAQTQAQHMGRAGDRIAQERQMFAGQQFGLGNRYEDRRWDLDDTSLQIQLDDIARRGAAGGEGSIPTDERERTLFGLGLLSKYGAWSAPILQEYGLLPPDFDPSMVPGYVPPEG